MPATVISGGGGRRCRGRWGGQISGDVPSRVPSWGEARGKRPNVTLNEMALIMKRRVARSLASTTSIFNYRARIARRGGGGGGGARTVKRGVSPAVSGAVRGRRASVDRPVLSRRHTRHAPSPSHRPADGRASRFIRRRNCSKPAVRRSRHADNTPAAALPDRRSPVHAKKTEVDGSPVGKCLRQDARTYART